MCGNLLALINEGIVFFLKFVDDIVENMESKGTIIDACHFRRWTHSSLGGGQTYDILLCHVVQDIYMIAPLSLGLLARQAVALVAPPSEASFTL
jgi:hypothetical protein